MTNSGAGTRQLNFLKTYSNSSYTFISTPRRSDASYTPICVATEIYNNYLTLKTNSYTGDIWWRCEGYIS